MSRIGRMPITVPAGVTVNVAEGNVVTVKGPKGELTQSLRPEMIIKQEGTTITVERPSDDKLHRSVHGLTRTLLHNMVIGVTEGFKKELDVNGVGYRVAVKGNVIELQVGFSHPVLVELPAGLSAKVEGQKLTIMGADKVLVGEMAARIRRIRKPEPYKGKGIKYETETILRKAGKSGGKGK